MTQTILFRMSERKRIKNIEIEGLNGKHYNIERVEVDLVEKDDKEK